MDRQNWIDRRRGALVESRIAVVKTLGDGAWHIEVSEHARMLDIAVLVRHLGILLRAEHMGGGEFHLHPSIASSSPPAQAAIDETLMRSARTGRGDFRMAMMWQP